MSIYRAFVQRALDGVRSLARKRAHIASLTLVLGVATTPFTSAFGPSLPVRVGHPPDPAARLQVILQSIWIIDDRDLWGSGEFTLGTNVCLQEAFVDPFDACPKKPRVIVYQDLSGDTGNNLDLTRVIPRDGDSMAPDVSPEGGIPVYPGQHSVFVIGMSEGDFRAYDDMGRAVTWVDEEHGWGIGTFATEGMRPDGSRGDFVLSYEIRRMPLPDLQVGDARVTHLDDGREVICTQIVNRGALPSGPTPLTERINDTVFRVHTVAALEPGQTTQECLFRSELPGHTLTLEFFVDEARVVPEMDERNNGSTLLVVAVPPVAAGTGASTVAGPETASTTPATMPSPEPTPSGNKPEPSGEKADLAVKAIKVNGQAPDGKDDCKVGKNGVTVVVKNDGAGDAGSFAVHLTVDGGQTDATVDALRVGEEREVPFENVQLKRGEHKLTATVAPSGSPRGAGETNDTRTVSATCKGGE